MRLAIIIVGLFLLGGAAALWFGLAPEADRLAGTDMTMSDDLPLSDLESTAPDGEPAVEEAPEPVEPPVQAGEAFSERAEATLPVTAEPASPDVPLPDSTMAVAPADPAVTPEAAAPQDATEPLDEAATETPDGEPAQTLSVPGLSAETSTATAEAPEPEPVPETAPIEAPAVAATPAPRREPLPAEPLGPAEALAAISPELTVPAAPPVRSPRPAENIAEAEPATPPDGAAPSSLDASPAEPTGVGPAVEPAATDEAAARTAAPPSAPSTPATSEPAEEPASRRIDGDRVNVRVGPGTDTASLGRLSRGDSVQVLESRADWVRIRTPRGTEGWVAAQFLAD